MCNECKEPTCSECWDYSRDGWCRSCSDVAPPQKPPHKPPQKPPQKSTKYRDFVQGIAHDDITKNHRQAHFATMLQIADLFGSGAEEEAMLKMTILRGHLDDMETDEQAVVDVISMGTLEGTLDELEDMWTGRQID